MTRKNSKRKTKSIYDENPDREWFIRHGQRISQYCGGFQVDSPTGESGEDFRIYKDPEGEDDGISVEDLMKLLREKVGK